MLELGNFIYLLLYQQIHRTSVEMHYLINVHLIITLILTIIINKKLKKRIQNKYVMMEIIVNTVLISANSYIRFMITRTCLSMMIGILHLVLQIKNQNNLKRFTTNTWKQPKIVQKKIRNRHQEYYKKKRKPRNQICYKSKLL